MKLVIGTILFNNDVIRKTKTITKSGSTNSGRYVNENQIENYYLMYIKCSK